MEGRRLSGHARDLGGDRWELIVNLPRRPDQMRGGRTTKRISAKGVRRANTALKDWIAELEQHNCADPKRITLGEVLRRWLEHRRVRPKTRERYEQLVDQHLTPDLGKWRVCDLTDLDLLDYYQRKQESGRLDGKGGLSAQTAKHLHAVIRAALTWAQEHELVDDNPAARVKHPPAVEPRKRVVWSPLQISDAIRHAHRTQLRVPIALAGWAGLRRGEVCALRWCDVDLDGAALAVRQSVEQVCRELHFGPPKSQSSRRTVPLPRQLVTLLTEHKRVQDEMRLAQGPSWNERGLVVCRVDGHPMMPDTLTTGWAQFVSQHALEPRIEFHGLRRSYLSQLHDRGAPDKLVQDVAGHADMRTTHDHYFVTFDETAVKVLRDQEEAIADAEAVLDSARVCQSSASAVISLDSERQKRQR